MRAFRVVCVLNMQDDFTNCFSVYGALRRHHKGELYRSLRAAKRAAEAASKSGWHATIVRRAPQGWREVVTARAVPCERADAIYHRLMEAVDWEAADTRIDGHLTCSALTVREGIEEMREFAYSYAMEACETPAVICSALGNRTAHDVLAGRFD
jgi:hypothetical protein